MPAQLCHTRVAPLPDTQSLLLDSSQMYVTASCETSPAVPGLIMSDVDNSSLYRLYCCDSGDCLIEYV